VAKLVKQDAAEDRQQQRLAEQHGRETVGPAHGGEQRGHEEERRVYE
jgi:hypothetical protein